MSSVCFIDNDIILKLATCDLFGDAIAILNFQQEDLRVLATSVHVFRKTKRVRGRYSQDICDRAKSIAEDCAKVQQNISNEMSLLQDIEGIDQGEMLLISAALQEQSFSFMTGDKRCLEAIFNANSLEGLMPKLNKRFICLEQIILKLIYVQGFDVVLPKVLPACEYDGALKACFGSGERVTAENVIQSLKAYIRDLKSKTGDLLFDL